MTIVLCLLLIFTSFTVAALFIFSELARIGNSLEKLASCVTPRDKEPEAGIDTRFMLKPTVPLGTKDARAEVGEK